MNELQKVFDYSGVQIRTIVKNDEVWFVARDICEILEHSQVSKAVERLDDDEKLLGTIFLSGQNRETWLINESGLYSLILTSRKPEAKQFKRWVTHEVLPTIRKTGGFVANEDMFIQTYLPHADDQTKLMFRATLETIRKQNEQIAIMQPKAKYFDALVDRNLLTNFRDTAKELEIGPRKFIEWLLDNKFVYRDRKGKLKPYAQYVPELFKLKDFERNGKAGVQTLITPKGKESFRLLIKGEAS
ncbi:phage antirepressor KilAC domain-containing protein [Neobacillus sedimentimangrovi]|uniref:Phage antirepressor KilAC domain-containing protein n=1 Tax=Neobacillus sedimentimangrovi TaxID=2699460 RepID=A0ABS8QGA4_9BACI|nr:BRO family protein [Neobacillus sedimentimangrovi]MCD4838137.1 phage antirepressor KilAC domain-containing protein [Neobacillus sedimentimangrovi]